MDCSQKSDRFHLEIDGYDQFEEYALLLAEVNEGSLQLNWGCSIQQKLHLLLVVYSNFKGK